MKHRLLTLLIACVSLTGCRDDNAATPDDAAAAPPESIVERGPLTLRVAMERGEITVGDRVTLSIEMITPDTYDVRMPTFDETIGPFTVRESMTPPDIPDNDTRRWRHEYVLDTFTPGDLEIPTIEVSYLPTDAASPEAQPGSLISEPMSVTVRSVLAADDDLTSFRDIRTETDVPLERRPIPWVPIVLGSIVTALVVAGAVLLLRRVSSDEQAVVVVPPGEWAMNALDALEAEQLVERGEFEMFYDRLSGIVRQYIERRFHLMAPERTTDEFLREARQSAVLHVGQQQLLEGFLRAADMVKFARHTPSANECTEALSAARAFVHETRAGLNPHDPAEAAA